jgi:hypothetical protein
VLILSGTGIARNLPIISQSDVIGVGADDKAVCGVSAKTANGVFAREGRTAMLQLNASSTASGFAAPDTRTLIAERVRGEFREMPGLTLTLA